MTSMLPKMTILYVIASDPGTITPIQGVGFAIREPGSFKKQGKMTATEDSRGRGTVPGLTG